jgi:hypothetical protein
MSRADLWPGVCRERWSAGSRLAQALGALLALLRHQGADRFRWASRIDEAARKFRFWEDRRVLLDKNIIFHNGTIENDGVVLDHTIAAHRASMHDGVPANGSTMADDRGINVMDDMYGPVLSDREAVSGAHEMAIAAEHRTGCDDGAPANFNLA